MGSITVAVAPVAVTAVAVTAVAVPVVTVAVARVAFPTTPMVPIAVPAIAVPRLPRRHRAMRALTAHAGGKQPPSYHSGTVYTRSGSCGGRALCSYTVCTVRLGGVRKCGKCE